MNYKRWLPQVVGLALVMLFLAACGATQHAAVQRVRAFHEAINAIEPGEGPDVTVGTQALIDIYREHTTQPGIQMSLLELAMASGTVRFSNVDYELVSENANRAVVKATGNITIGEKTETLDKQYVVEKQDGKWLIARW
jgi:hypothetical protein